MPELPEVETIVRTLKSIILNRTISSIKVLKSSIIKTNINSFTNALLGCSFVDINRIGKFIIFHLSNNHVLIVHLRMEGKFYYLKNEQSNSKYARVIFYLDNGYKLIYDDSRMFGLMILSNEENYKNVKDISTIGLDPFEIENVDNIYKKISKSNLAIKTLLLDQSIISGLGNIYVDEVLYDCSIHPETSGRFITYSQIEDIIKASRIILNEAIKNNGSTIKTYHSLNNENGSFQNFLKVYGRKDQCCHKCNSILRFKKINGRGTTFCPTCQVELKKQLKIALYGKIASGKSTALNYFKEEGCLTISCDNIVQNLYKQKDVINTINKMFSLCFDKEVDKKVLADYLISHKTAKKQLEGYIHPLVKEEIDAFVKKNKSYSLIVVEVPLLYESKMDSLFDIIVALDIDDVIREKRLINRNPTSAKYLIEVNKKHKFDKNKYKADFILKNDGDLFNLQKQIKEIINKCQSRLMK